MPAPGICIHVLKGEKSFISDDFIMTSKGGNDYIALTAFKLGVGDEVWTKRGLSLKEILPFTH